MEQNKKGFTLLELLITIGIIAILSVAIVFVLNPAETLKKSRDSQRMSDLSTLKTAIALYVTSTSTPYLAGASSNAACKASTAWEASDKIYYSSPSSSLITDADLDGCSSTCTSSQVTSASSSFTDGGGWIPVNLDGLPGGSPISAMPLDPTNDAAYGASALDVVTSAGLVYRYACRENTVTFEIDAQLESDAFTVDDNRRTKDGGNNDNYYEAGTNLKILGTGTNF
ncbi:MAG: type II secretion system protein [Candidatus Liptonbacteria bacterium]